MFNLGHSKILKCVHKLIPGKEDFRNIVVPAAITLFKSLIDEKNRYEEESKDKIKKTISPLFMCLIEEPFVYNEIIDNFGELPKAAKTYIKDKFDSILKTILRTPDSANSYLREMYKKQKTTADELLVEEYKSLMESFKGYMRKQGRPVLPRCHVHGLSL